MSRLSLDELNDLNAPELAERIDEFIYGVTASTSVGTLASAEFQKCFIGVKAAAILQSGKLSALDHAQQKRLLLFFFRSRFQTLAADQWMFDHGPLAARSGFPMRFHTAIARQNLAISARIAFECLMEFVAVVQTGHAIKKSGKKSKLKAFREMLYYDRQFGWLLLSLPLVYRYDRTHRSPEIHGTSSVAIDALCGGVLPSLYRESLLVGFMQTVWSGVLEALNGETVRTQFNTYPADKHIIQANISSWPAIDLRALWESNWKDLDG